MSQCVVKPLPFHLSRPRVYQSFRHSTGRAALNKNGVVDQYTTGRWASVVGRSEKTVLGVGEEPGGDGSGSTEDCGAER